MPWIESPEEDPSVPPPEEQPGQKLSRQKDSALAYFVRSCQDSVDKGDRQGQLDYPPTLEARMDKATTYNAALDVRDTPAPPSEVISAPNAAAESVTVQCQVAARLTPVGDNIEVTTPDDAEDGGWEYQEFTAQGVLEWSWDVTPKTPDDEQLKLELRPAVKGLTAAEVALTAEVEYYTKVDVHASPTQSVSHWFETDWNAWLAVVGAVSGAALGLVTFSAAFREALARWAVWPAPGVQAVAPVGKAGGSNRAMPSKGSKRRRPPKRR